MQNQYAFPYLRLGAFSKPHSLLKADTDRPFLLKDLLNMQIRALGASKLCASRWK